MRSKIQAIILDVDGVIIGEKIGFNSPDPHAEVLQAMREVSQSEIPIVLCTAKPAFAIGKIIENAGLRNFHIADGGGLVINPLNKEILSKHLISKAVAKKVVSKLLSENIYTEVYTPSEYVIQKSQLSSITKDHQQVLATQARAVDSLVEEIDSLEIIKIMPIAKNIEHKKIVDEILQKFSAEILISWGVHPVILPLQFGIVTAPGISKSVATLEIAKNLKIKMENVLGVGDSVSDWQFIEPCGYGVAMGNAHQELKELVASKKQNSFVAPSVDENGIIEAFRHFGLLEH